MSSSAISPPKERDAVVPSADPKAFTDSEKVDGWFCRNCGDVLQRECSAAEKAELLAWLSTRTTTDRQLHSSARNPIAACGAKRNFRSPLSV